MKESGKGKRVQMLEKTGKDRRKKKQWDITKCKHARMKFVLLLPLHRIPLHAVLQLLLLLLLSPSLACPDLLCFFLALPCSASVLGLPLLHAIITCCNDPLLLLVSPLRCSCLLCLFLSSSCAASLLPSCSTAHIVTASFPSLETKLHHNSTVACGRHSQLHHGLNYGTKMPSRRGSTARCATLPLPLHPYLYSSPTLNFVNTGQVNPNHSLCLSCGIWQKVKLSL